MFLIDGRATMIRLNHSLAALVTAGMLTALPILPVPGQEATPSRDVQLSGPFTSGNLTIFLVRDPKRPDGKTFLTLDEALEQKKVIVHETKNVNQLSIDNVSKDEEVFIQAGDIVKGGQQDRVLGFDFVVPAGIKAMPLACFCVEAGRWNGRSGESASSFANSKECLSSNPLKIAARAQSSQQEVWNNVAKAQAALSKNVQADVKDKRSSSSLQLTLENKKLNETIDTTRKELEALPAKEKEGGVIGCVVAINGTVIGADTYVSPALFRKLWPKLLKAAAVEAIAERKEGLKYTPPDMAAARAFLANAEKGAVTKKALPGNTTVTEKTGDKVLLFETCSADHGSTPLRRNYLTRMPEPVRPAPSPRNDSPQSGRR
jgi:hypothetical protein